MLFCNKEDCSYRSKKPSKYVWHDKPLYKCKCSLVIIDEFLDGDRDMYIPTFNSCMCMNYKEAKNERI